jgi:hypothetical protein
MNSDLPCSKGRVGKENQERGETKDKTDLQYIGGGRKEILNSCYI